MGTRNFLFLLACLSFIASCSSFRSRQEPAAPPAPPPVNEKVPVGIYLGPGGMRSYAHIGVLRALHKENIKITAIGGMEWGAVAAASYALSGAANEVEWQMLKLRRDLLPTSGFLKGQVLPRDANDLRPFFEQIFSKSFDQAVMPFSCPTSDGNSVGFIEEPSTPAELLRCVALPPLYEYGSRNHFAVSGIVSAPNWAEVLKKQGAQYIIYVDILGRGRLQSGQYGPESYARSMLAALRSLSKQQHSQANFVIDVPIDIELVDFDRRREAIAVGEKAALSQISDILPQITKRAKTEGERPIATQKKKDSKLWN